MSVLQLFDAKKTAVDKEDVGDVSVQKSYRGMKKRPWGRWSTEIHGDAGSGWASSTRRKGQRVCTTRRGGSEARTNFKTPSAMPFSPPFPPSSSSEMKRNMRWKAQWGMENDLGFSRQDRDERPKERWKTIWALVGKTQIKGLRRNGKWFGL